jgi:hypothetical protein
MNIHKKFNSDSHWNDLLFFHKIFVSIQFQRNQINLVNDKSFRREQLTTSSWICWTAVIWQTFIDMTLNQKFGSNASITKDDWKQMHQTI